MIQFSVRQWRQITVTARTSVLGRFVPYGVSCFPCPDHQSDTETAQTIAVTYMQVSGAKAVFCLSTENIVFKLDIHAFENDRVGTFGLVQCAIPIKIDWIRLLSCHEHESGCVSPFAKTAALTEVKRIVAVSCTNIELNVIKSKITIELESNGGFMRTDIRRELRLDTPMLTLPLLRKRAEGTHQEKTGQPLFHRCCFRNNCTEDSKLSTLHFTVHAILLPFMHQRLSNRPKGLHLVYDKMATVLLDRTNYWMAIAYHVFNGFYFRK